MYKRFDWKIELISVLILCTQLGFVLTKNVGKELISLIIGCFIYFLLSIIFYFSVSPKIVFNTKRKMNNFGERTELTEVEKLAYVNKGISFLSALKLVIVLIPVILPIQKYFTVKHPVLDVLIIIVLLMFSLMMLLYAINNFLKADGYLKATLTNGIVYNNPNDQRIVVDKPFGIGSTVNLAHKQGRVILWIILSIPTVIITLLIIVFAFIGKK